MSNTARPPIHVTQTELGRLSELACAAENREPAAAYLMEELARTEVTPLENVPPEVVRMHHRVSFLYDAARYDNFERVYPFQARIEARKISILTQVGAALIGLNKGIRCTGMKAMAATLA
jgi:regulator of nucleoside diphosphate kinase